MNLLRKIEKIYSFIIGHDLFECPGCGKYLIYSNSYFNNYFCNNIKCNDQRSYSICSSRVLYYIDRSTSVCISAYSNEIIINNRANIIYSGNFEFKKSSKFLKDIDAHINKVLKLLAFS